MFSDEDFKCESCHCDYNDWCWRCYLTHYVALLYHVSKKQANKIINDLRKNNLDDI